MATLCFKSQQEPKSNGRRVERRSSRQYSGHALVVQWRKRINENGVTYGRSAALFSTDRLPPGAPPFRDRVIDTDATVVERLEQAGAVLIAKLATGELAH